jgi:hypothetical protein
MKKKKVMTLWIQSGNKNHLWQIKMSFTGMSREIFFGLLQQVQKQLKQEMFHEFLQETNSSIATM